MPLFYCLTDSKFAVNCGGLQLTSGGTVFEEDNAAIGAASYYVSDAKGWAVSNVGSFTDNRSISYTTDFSSQTNTISSKLYQTSRVSPGSLRYYGLRLENGLYNISLRFVETAFDDSRTWERVGKRVFDIYIQVCILNQYIFPEQWDTIEEGFTVHNVLYTILRHF